MELFIVKGQSLNYFQFRFKCIIVCLLILLFFSINSDGQVLNSNVGDAYKSEESHVLNFGYKLEKILPAKYVTDGSIDYTSFIQQALDKYQEIVFPAFPILIDDTGLILRNNQKLYFKKGSSLILAPSSKGGYQILTIHDVSNVSIYNSVIRGDKYTHTGKSGEWGMGISIRGSSNIRIFNALIEKCWGDGIYIGQSNLKPFADNVYMKNVICDDNRRNGISIISGTNITIQSPIVRNSSGTPPMGGIDIEANNKSDNLNNISILDAITENNQFGISIYTSPLNDIQKKQVNITVKNHVDNGSKMAFQFGTKGDNLNGTVLISNSSWNNNQEVIKVVNYQPNGGIKVVFDKIKVLKADNGNSKEIQSNVFFNLKRNLKLGDTGVVINK